MNILIYQDILRLYTVSDVTMHSRAYLFMAHVLCMRHNSILGLSGSTTFSTFAHKVHDFRKEDTEYKTCGLIFSKNFI
jgi:hypothetical protein